MLLPVATRGDNFETYCDLFTISFVTIYRKNPTVQRINATMQKEDKDHFETIWRENQKRDDRFYTMMLKQSRINHPTLVSILSMIFLKVQL